MTTGKLPFPDFLDPANPLVAPIRAIFDAMGDLFFVVFDDGRIRRANRTAQQRLGYREEELAGRDITMVHAPDHVEEVRRFVESALSGGSGLCHSPLVTRSGERIPAETSATRVSLGPVRFLVWTCRDISPRQRAEAALRKSEERYRTTIDALGDMVHVVDSDLRIVLCNELFRTRLIELGVEGEPIGCDVFELQPFLPDKVRQEYARVFESRAPLVSEEMITVNREVIWTETRKLPILDEQGGVTGIVTVIRDVTQRKQLEDDLRQVQKMETLGALAGGVAHDFNNLLMAIKVYAGFAKKPRPGGVEPARAIEEVIRAAESAQTLTSQLLAFSRRQLLRPRVLMLDAVVGDLRELLGRLIGSNVELVVEHQADLWPVRADLSQLQQVLVNMAVNARDAIGGSAGRFEIATSNAVLTTTDVRGHTDARPGEFVRVRVSDNGSGMEETVVRRVFEPFFTTKELGRGTGLGLSTAYGTVRQHGGFILVNSTPGAGSTFDIYLPRSEVTAGAIAQAPDRPGEPRGTETILVAEDEQLVRNLMIEVLSGLGYRVLSARDGREALAVAEEHAGEFDLLVTDVVMPEIGGRELSERLIETNPGLPVLFVTGYTEDEIVRRGFYEGEVPLLRKPFGSEDLAQMVRALLDRVDEKVTVPPR